MAQMILIAISLTLFGGGALLLGHGVLQWLNDARKVESDGDRDKGSPSQAA